MPNKQLYACEECSTVIAEERVSQLPSSCPSCGHEINITLGEQTLSQKMWKEVNL